jgi:hypothetical protein
LAEVSDATRNAETSNAMKTRVNRRTVDLSRYPDLVVVYLGMRVNVLAGMKTLLRLGPQIENAAGAAPDGLLHCEQNIIYSLVPLHIGMRWYWRDFASLEAWTRSAPHRDWWKQFLRHSGGTGFWHETYSMHGAMEAIYDDVPRPIGFAAFAPVSEAKGGMFSARRRLELTGDSPPPPEGTSEREIY